MTWRWPRPAELGVRPLADPGAPPGPAANARTRSLAGDAWRDLRRNPIFWIAPALVARWSS